MLNDWQKYKNSNILIIRVLYLFDDNIHFPIGQVVIFRIVFYQRWIRLIVFLVMLIIFTTFCSAQRQQQHLLLILEFWRLHFHDWHTNHVRRFRLFEFAGTSWIWPLLAFASRKVSFFLKPLSTIRSPAIIGPYDCWRFSLSSKKLRSFLVFKSERI